MAMKQQTIEDMIEEMAKKIAEMEKRIKAMEDKH